MSLRAVRALLGCLVLCLCSPFTYVDAKVRSYVEGIDCSYEFSGMFKPEMFFGKNVSLLNSNNGFDRIIFWRHMIDLNLDVIYGLETHKNKSIEFFSTIRNRGIWGNPRSIAGTTLSPVKLSETVFGPHDHALPRHILWIRELWMEIDLGEALRLSLPRRTTFTIGAFKFELGRGISLGSAYAVGPEVLGFYTDDIVDQYAFGAKLSGLIVDPNLTYDFYTALLNNKSSSLGDTGEFIYGQAYGRQNCPERGYGIVTFLVAGRLFWSMFNNEACGKATFEPYWLYVNDPEQRVEFLGGASSLLGTIGAAGEYEGPCCGFGFDYGLNLGQQWVRGWDRNTINISNISGTLTEVNSQAVYQNPNNPADPQNGKKIPYVSGPSQDIIEDATRAEAFNGQIIGTVAGDLGYLNGPTIYIANSATRFRDPYENKFDGWMFVIDGELKRSDDSLKIAATAGIASGDENPHTGNKDGVYSGFISVQELYYGKRVKSAFILGSAGKLKRPLSLPINRLLGRAAPSLLHFTNIRFTGFALNKKKKWDSDRSFNINPNILFFWQDEPTPCFDVATRKDLNRNAEQFLGTELNFFAEYYPLKNFKAFFIFSTFIPGGHWDDILGKPLTSAQVAALDRRDVSGYTKEGIPNLGSNVAVTYNLGFEYTF